MTNHPPVTNDPQPRAEHECSFGLWTVGNRGRDAFGDAGRPHISPIETVSLLAQVWLVEFLKGVGYSGSRTSMPALTAPRTIKVETTSLAVACACV